MRFLSSSTLWDVNGNVSNSNGFCAITGVGGWGANGISSKQKFDKTVSPYIAEFNWKTSTTANGKNYLMGFGNFSSNTGDGCYLYPHGPATISSYVLGSMATITGSLWVANTPQTGYIALTGSNGWSVSSDGVNNTNGSTYSKNNVPLIFEAGSSSSTLNLDWVRVRKYNTSVPTVTVNSTVLYADSVYGSIPVVNFISNTVSGVIPVNITFTDTSIYLPISWQWDFGDGTNSTVQNPTHTYSSAGTYTVKLTADNGFGSGNLSKPSYITANSTALASTFTSNITNGQVPFAVKFTDTSTGNPSSWDWDFGDGTNSTDQNPIHIYSTSGWYNVSLNVTDINSSNISIKCYLIEATGTRTYESGNNINWSGVTWTTRNGVGNPWNNNWSSGANNVYTDSDNKLHMWIHNDGGIWYSSELDSKLSYRYGTFTWHTSSPVLNDDKNAVLGMFTYYNDSQELDIEASGWSNNPSNKLWYSVQPASIAGNGVSYVPSTSTNTTLRNVTYIIDWEPGFVYFTAKLPDNSILAEWNYTNVSNVPYKYSKTIMNIWQFRNNPPSDGKII